MIINYYKTPTTKNKINHNTFFGTLTFTATTFDCDSFLFVIVFPSLPHLLATGVAPSFSTGFCTGVSIFDCLSYLLGDLTSHSVLSSVMPRHEGEDGVRGKETLANEHCELSLKSEFIS